MGMEIPEHVIGSSDAETSQVSAPTAGDNLPRILVAGPPNVGKQTVLQRLLSFGKQKGSTFNSSGLLCHGCTIDTKYYTADVCITTACLTTNDANEIAKAYAQSSYCQALVLVFDLSNLSTFEPIREWVSTLQLDNLEVLLCVGNKADRLPDHFAHAEYRRRLQKRGESTSDPHPEFWDFGIQPSDGTGLLSDEGNSLEEIRSQCREWCTDNGIEYLEACAVDRMFDKCMSIDGDEQGISRVWSSLTAHIWPGMVMKTDQGLANSISLNNIEDESSDEESEVSIQYERLSNGSADLWDGDEGPWTFYSAEQPMDHRSSETEAGSVIPNSDTSIISAPESSSNTAAEYSSHNKEVSDAVPFDNNHEVSDAVPCSNTGNVDTSVPADQCSLRLPSDTPAVTNSTEKTIEESSFKTDMAQNNEASERSNGNGIHENHTHQENDSMDIEQLMMEMSRMRENARFMPDSQRREMAANLALRMAAFFDESD